MPMIQLEKPVLTGTMPVVWPTILDLGRDECKRILRKLELEAYAGVISALRAQGDLTKEKKDLLGELTKILGISTERHRAEVRRAVNDERLTTIAYHMSGPNSSSEWSIEGRRLIPLLPRLVPQTAFTVTANAVASATANQNASLLLPAETGNKEVVVCYSYTSTTCTSTNATSTSGAMGVAVKSPRPPSPSSNVVVLPSGSTVYVKSVSCSDEDEKPRKRRRTNSSSSSPVMLKEVSKISPQVSKSITVPMGSSPKMSNIMQSIANSLPPHLSPVKITFTKPTIQTTNTTTQKVIIVTTSPSSNFVPNILSKSHAHNAAALSKLGASTMLTAPTQKQTVVFPSTNPNTVAVTSVVSSSPSVVMSTVSQCSGSSAVKVASARLPSPKTLVGSPTQILAQFTKQHSPKHLQQGSPLGVTGIGQTQVTSSLPGTKPTIQIKQESGVKIITQQVQPSKILPKPSSVALSGSSSSPIMVVSSNGAIMTTKLVTQPTASQGTYTRPTVGTNIGARISAAGGGATYVKTTSGSIITVVPKSLATLGGKIISSNIVSGTTTKITTIPMTSKPNVIVVQKTTGKGATIQGLPGKNVVTTLLNAGRHTSVSALMQGEKSLQAIQGTKPAIITASRPITKMIVTQPKGLSAGSQATATKIIPTKIVYGQQGKTQVLIKPKPVFQTAVVSEQTRQLVTETLQQVTRAAEAGHVLASCSEGSAKDEVASFTEASSSAGEASHGSGPEMQPVVQLFSSREHEWTEQEVSVESGPTIIYQEVTGGESQSATSTIKALLELQQITVKEKGEAKLRQHTIDLSQLAVPIQLTQDKRPSAESSRPSTSEAEPSTEFLSTGKVSRVGEDLNFRPAAVSAAAAASHASHMASESKAVLEVGDLEGDTLDPQTGLFYRSSQPAADPVKPTSSSVGAQPPPVSQAEADQSRHTSTSTKAPPPPPQLQSKPQMSQPSSSSSTAFPSTPPLTKNLPKLREQTLPKPQTLTQSPKDRPLPAPAQLVAKVTTPSTPTKLLVTPQLPKLQQAPTSHHRPLHTPMSHPPPLQAHHPVSTVSSQQPIITQSATVTKITFGSSHHSSPVFSSAEATAKLVPESSSGPPGVKPSVSDILKISMMEAEIDPSTEPMVVDSSSDCGPLGKALAVQAVSGTLDSGKESKKRKKKAKKLKKKQKKKDKKRSEAESAEEKDQEETVSSTVRPEEIPAIPENRFLMRRSPQAAQKSNEVDEKDHRHKEERQRESSSTRYNSQSAYNRRLVMTKSGRKIKGRGPRRYRTPSRSRSRDRFRRSETPPHWRQELQRQRMRAVTGERWIKGDRGDMNEAKDEAAKAPRRERRASSTKHEKTSEGKKEKKSRSHRSKSKEEETAEEEKPSKHKAKKQDKSPSRSKSREKSRRSKSRDKGHKHKSEDRRGRSRSKNRNSDKKEKESNRSKDKNKSHESDDKHKEDPKGRNGEGTKEKSKSKERTTSKDGHRSGSKNRDRHGSSPSKEKEEKREKDGERGREHSRSKERQRTDERENKRRGTSRDRERRSRSPDRNKTKDSHRSRRSRSKSDQSKDQSSHRRDKAAASQRRRRSSSSSDSDRNEKSKSRKRPESKTRPKSKSRSRDRRSPDRSRPRPDSTKGKDRKDSRRNKSSSSSSSDSD